MSYSLKIKNIAKENVIVDNSDVVVVEAQILDAKKKVVATKKFGYPLGTPQKEIEADLKKVLHLHTKEEEDRIKDAERNKLQDVSDKTITSLKNFEIHDTKSPSKDRNKK